MTNSPERPASTPAPRTPKSGSCWVGAHEHCECPPPETLPVVNPSELISQFSKRDTCHCECHERAENPAPPTPTREQVEAEMCQPYCETHSPKGITCACDLHLPSEVVAQIEKGREDVAAGRTVTLEQLRAAPPTQPPSALPEVIQDVIAELRHVAQHELTTPLKVHLEALQICMELQADKLERSALAAPRIAAADEIIEACANWLERQGEIVNRLTQLGEKGLGSGVYEQNLSDQMRHELKGTLALPASSQPAPEESALYASYANHCAIRKEVPMTWHSWKKERNAH